ncbi:hypothetical protein BsIDN1_50360 [Bacillus safensis]|uniref:Uncharacterized protein n=1 Tax=Bacillus safensis TaxID=561879 RepID=A0A5S9MEJ1_BACIA|nr:hypothetical protein BsIDN1_50360 [Bacillus safensis]
MRQNRAITIKKKECGQWIFFNLRGAVIQNITGHNQEQLEHTILDAIQSGEKKKCCQALACCSKCYGKKHQKTKNEILETLEQGLKPQQQQKRSRFAYISKPAFFL